MRNFSMLMLTIILGLTLVGCQDKEGAHQMPAPYVKVFKITQQDYPWPSEFQATASGSRAAEVRARVQGIIQKRLYREGSFLKKGQPMFLIERDHYDAVYQQAKAAFHNAERDWKRIQPLYSANAVSQKERDAALSSYDKARASLREAKINLDYCEVLSPVSGFSSKECMTEGNLVNVNTLLTTVNQTDPMYIDFSIPALDRLQRQRLEREGRLSFPEGSVYKAKLRLLDGSMHPGEGRIDFIDKQVDVDTGVIYARATFPNADGVIMPGQYTRISMEGDILRNAILIPQKAVRLLSNGESLVALVDSQNVVKFTKVDLGPFIGNYYLVYAGLKDGDTVVSDGLLKVREGAPVRYDDPSQPAAAGAAKQ